MKIVLLLVVVFALNSCSTRHTLTTAANTVQVAAATFSSDKGESFHDAVIVNGVKNQREGVAAEYRYISDLHGRRGQDWFLVGQTVISKQDKFVDVVEIQLNNPSDRKLFYFDATAYLLKN